jgi:hypothetical protein
VSLPQTPFWRGFAALVAAVASSAVALQFALTLDHGRGVAWGVLLYFGYFTILTNALVALALAAPLVAPHAWLGRFFARRRVLAGVAAARRACASVRACRSACPISSPRRTAAWRRSSCST